LRSPYSELHQICAVLITGLIAPDGHRGSAIEQARPEDVTRLLLALGQGDSTALDRLFPLVYEDLRAIAHRLRRRWRSDDTLDTTALVHEAYLKLLGRISWESRSHFFATAAKAMRHVLINYARRTQAQRRGGDQLKVSLEEISDSCERELALSDENADLLSALGSALETLERVNERQSRIVECRYFGGMTVQETAAALGISTATVSRGWALAQVRLFQAMQRELHS
jgi:RNA polymerase sigma factor (TIGR02999 family)